MTVNEVYNHLGSFLSELLPENKWIKAELFIEIQPGYLGMSGECVTADEIISLRTKYSEELKEKIRWLHEVSTEGGKNKWNKAKFTILPDKQFQMDFTWDEDWQNRIDRYNKEAEMKDSGYKAPKWSWEK